MDKVKRYIPYLLLTGLTLFFCRMFVGRYGIFGAKVDWLSQHSVLPDYFRQQFYATGKLFPEFAANLGGGQNIYHFAYYGLYSPLILPSYLLPFVKMSDYIMAVSITGLIASVLLFYYWLKSRKTDTGTAFILSLMFLLAGPMIGQYSGQIMFVDYMPFLCLALIGVDRYFEQEKSGLFTVSVFLMIMTSFYFSIGGMLSLVLYGLHRYFEQREGNRVTVRSFLRDGLCFVRSMILAVLMSGFFLVPTALALTGGRSKEQNTSFASFFIPQITVERFAYSIYGIGLTTLVITVLLTGLLYRKVYEKVLTYGCVIVLVIPVFAYLLNGGLYIRDKVFIPFLPLLCYLISIYLDWVNDFIYAFATYQVPGHYLNSLKRVAIKGQGNTKFCEFSDGVVSYAKGRKITENGKIIKDGDTLFLPFVHEKSTYIAYSKNGDCRDWSVFEDDKTMADVYKITENGNEFIREIPINNNKLHINLPEKIGYKIILK